MKPRKRSVNMLSTTRIAVVLAVNIQMERGGDFYSVPIPLLVITGLFFRLWATAQTITYWWQEMVEIIAVAIDLIDAFEMAAAVFWNIGLIAGKSVWFGIAS